MMMRTVLKDSMKPVISIQHLSTAYGKHTIHQDLSLDVYQGEVMAIVGGSGSGKTTLMRHILALQKPVAGHIYLFGTELFTANQISLQACRLQTGVLFQHGALFSTLSVMQNVAYPLREYTDYSATTVNELAMLKLQLVGLSPQAAHQMPSELSGGMIKRAALARALALDPQILFLDEPTSGLDPHSAGAFDELIIELKSVMDLTVFMVTHDLDTLWQIADRVTFLGHGRVLACATMAELGQSEHSEVRAYFAGPRGRAAQQAYKVEAG